MLGNQVIGTAKVTKEGLYYRFDCRCRLSGTVVYQLQIACDGKTINLGVCIPMGDCFGVKTKVPIKRIGEKELSFYVEPRHTAVNGKFIPIRADEPFSYIEKLQKSYLEFQGGEPGVRIMEGDN